MKQVKLEIAMEFCSMDELSVDEQTVVKCACAATRNSYANYSHFHVGAAVMLDNGKVVIGANQENAAYPSGLCAERTALFYAKANYPEAKIIKIAISGDHMEHPKGEITTPCGNCRQALLEYECTQGSPITVLCVSSKGKVLEIPSVKNLLPFCFDFFYD